MKIRLFTFLFLLTGFSVSGQINLADSTVQILPHWKKGEQYHYKVSLNKMLIEELDTNITYRITYDLDLTVKDSTDQFYLIERESKNFHNLDTSNEIIELVADVSMVFKTDKFGVFQEVVNWEEVRDQANKATDLLSKKYSQQLGTQHMIQMTKNTYSSKKAIEVVAMKDIQQFNTFYGVKCKLGETLENQVQMDHLLGDKPFDVAVHVKLSEISEENNNYKMNAFYEIDQQQYIAATVAYYDKIYKKTIDVENLKDFKEETSIMAIIHHSGWPVYSLQTTTLNSMGIVLIEECIIERK